MLKLYYKALEIRLTESVYAKYFLSLSQREKVKVPLRRCSKVSDKYWCSADWFCSVLYCAVNSSSHLMKDGHEDKPCSNEFIKQVFPKFRRPGTSPTNTYVRVYTMKPRKTLLFLLASVLLGIEITLKLHYFSLFSACTYWKLPYTWQCAIAISMVVSKSFTTPKAFLNFCLKNIPFHDRDRFFTFLIWIDLYQQR